MPYVAMSGNVKVEIENENDIVLMCVSLVKMATCCIQIEINCSLYILIQHKVQICSCINKSVDINF